ncbi:MAG: hypothetical protein ACOYM4_05965 [Nodosilinea sp.]|jgi:hypothetical protein
MQLSITSYQIIAGALINALAVMIGASLNVFYAPWLQRKRDNKRWEREKLYELHTEAYESLTNLLKSVSTASIMEQNETSSTFYASTGALNRLKLAYTDKEAETIIAILTRIRYRSIAQVYEFPGLSQLRRTLPVQEPLY